MSVFVTYEVLFLSVFLLIAMGGHSKWYDNSYYVSHETENKNMGSTASLCYKVLKKIILEDILCVLAHLSSILKALWHFDIYDPQFMTGYVKGVFLESDKMGCNYHFVVKCGLLKPISNFVYFLPGVTNNSWWHHTRKLNFEQLWKMLLNNGQTHHSNSDCASSSMYKRNFNKLRKEVHYMIFVKIKSPHLVSLQAILVGIWLPK